MIKFYFVINLNEIAILIFDFKTKLTFSGLNLSHLKIPVDHLFENRSIDTLPIASIESFSNELRVNVVGMYVAYSTMLQAMEDKIDQMSIDHLKHKSKTFLDAYGLWKKSKLESIGRSEEYVRLMINKQVEIFRRYVVKKHCVCERVLVCIDDAPS